MQKLDSNWSAGTGADSEQNDQDLSVSQHSTKPLVVGSPLSADESVSKKILYQVREMMSAEPNWLEKTNREIGITYKALMNEFQ